MQFYGGALVARFGRRLAAGLFVVRAVAFVGVVLAAASWQLYPLIAVIGTATALSDVIANAGALHFEHDRRVPMMAPAYAFFSLASVGGTGLAGLLLDAGTGVGGLFGCAAAISIASVLVSDIARGLEHDTDAVRPRFDASVLRNKPVLAVAAWTLVAALGELTMYVWPVIYLRESLGASPAVAVLGSTAFYAAMVAGRVAGAPVQRRLGRLWMLRLSGLVVVAGMALFLSTASPAVTIAGVVVTGLAYASVVPLGYSVAGSLAPGKPAQVSALVGPAVSVASNPGCCGDGVRADPRRERARTVVSVLPGIRPKPDSRRLKSEAALRHGLTI